MPYNKRKLGNKGFSLVELLVGVMILAIIVTPLLHTMITAAKTAEKSRQLQNATLAAQNVVETMEALDFSEILSDITSFYNNSSADTGSLSSLTPSAALYTYDDANETYSAIDPATVSAGEEIYYLGLDNIASSTSSYNAMVKLDATVYPHVNNEDISVYTAMNAVFSQPADSNSSLQNPDSIAASEFAGEATLISLQAVDASAFTHSMLRTITITIVKSGENITAEAVFNYTTDFTYTTAAIYVDGTMTQPAHTYTVELTPYTCDYIFYSGNAADFESIHFFYYPNYNTATTLYYENIIIDNTSGLDLTFFLIKQNTPGYTDGVLSGVDYELNYHASLYLKEPFDLMRGNTSIAEVYTNMDVHLGSGGILFITSIFRVYNGIWFDYGTNSGTLVAKDDLKRLYDITVDLYPVSSNFTGDVTLSFNASKVE